MKCSIEIAKKGNLVCTNCLNWVKWLGWEWSDWKMFPALFGYMLGEWQVPGHIAEVLKFCVFLSCSWSALFMVSGARGERLNVQEGERCWNFMYLYFFCLLAWTLWRCQMGWLICPWGNWICLLVLSRFNQEWFPDGRCCAVYEVREPRSLSCFDSPIVASYSTRLSGAWFFKKMKWIVVRGFCAIATCSKGRKCKRFEGAKTWNLLVGEG